MKKTLIVVSTVALINEVGKILYAKRPDHKHLGGFWEFPGGKQELGETVEQTAVREIFEEIGVVINEKDLIPLTFGSQEYDDFIMLMPLFLCFRWQGNPRSKENQEIAWVKPEDLHLYPVPEVDIRLMNQVQIFLKNKDLFQGV